MDRKIDVISGVEGKSIVIIHDVIFKEKRYIKWKEVQAYLKRYVGDVYKVLSSKDSIYI